jgi:hypothetical protein
MSIIRGERILSAGTDEAIVGIKASGARIQSTVDSILSSLGTGATASPGPDQEAA